MDIPCEGSRHLVDRNELGARQVAALTLDELGVNETHSEEAGSELAQAARADDDQSRCTATTYGMLIAIHCVGRVEQAERRLAVANEAALAATACFHYDPSRCMAIAYGMLIATHHAD